MALTKYQQHTKRWLKAGKTMAQAARAWDKKKGKPKSSPGKSTSKAKTGKSTASNTGGSNRVADPFSESKIMSGGRKLALLGPAVFTVAQMGFTKAAAMEIARKYSGYDGGPIRSLEDIKRIAWNLAEGYAPYGVAKVVTTGIQKATTLVNRFIR